MKISDSAQKALDRLDRRDKKLKRRRRRMGVSGRGLLTITERLAEKQQAIRLRQQRQEAEQGE